MIPQDRGALGEFVRKHHLHYEVDPEEVVEGARRERVGAQVRLFATHESEKLPVPSCHRCADLLGDLRSFASDVIREEPPERAEIVPTAPALYKSTEVPDADEVALTIHVRCDAPEHRRPGAGADPCLERIRARLAEAGVPQR